MGNVINVQMDEDFYNEIIQGGGSGSGQASTVEYLDVSGLVGNIKTHLKMHSLYVKAYIEANNGKISGVSADFISTVSDKPIDSTIAVAIDFSQKIMVEVEGEVYNRTILQDLLDMSYTQEELDAIPRITKEEFYSLE